MVFVIPSQTACASGPSLKLLFADSQSHQAGLHQHTHTPAHQDYRLLVPLDWALFISLVLLIRQRCASAFWALAHFSHIHWTRSLDGYVGCAGPQRKQIGHMGATEFGLDSTEVQGWAHQQTSKAA